MRHQPGAVGPDIYAGTGNDRDPGLGPDRSRPDPSPRRLTRVTLITGAASGIGAALTRRLAAPGYALALHTRANTAGLAATAATARAAGAETLVLTGDLADPATPDVLIAATLARFGRLDALVANAGYADRTPTADVSDAALERAHQTLLASFHRLVRAALPALRDADRPAILAVSAFGAHVIRPGLPLFPATAAAKAGLEVLIRSLAVELAADGIAVNAVIPGFIRKDAGTQAALDKATAARQAEAIPLGRLGTPDEVAAAIAFFLSPQANGITGARLAVDGGLIAATRLFPPPPAA